MGQRRAWMLMVVIAALMALAAVIEAVAIGRRPIDPDGSFLGPSWIRLPLLLAAATAIDLLPLAIARSWRTPAQIPAAIARRWREHWTKERFTLVASGIISFYVVYVAYRNLKSYLPDVIHAKYDHDLRLLDHAVFFGHDPAILLQDVLGTHVSAWVLSYVYLWFLPMVPLVVTAWVVWVRNLSYGYWFVTSQCLAWTLGTISYYALPTLGPGLAYPFLFQDIPSNVPAKQLIDSLVAGRQRIIYGQSTDAVQSVAGFASLHVAITMLVALMIQYTMRQRWLKVLMWTDCGVTTVATIYFGWHNVADDLAGALIALVSFYVAGLATGQKFEGRGLRSHPTTTTSKVPVLQD